MWKQKQEEKAEMFSRESEVKSFRLTVSFSMRIAELSSKDSEALRIPPHDIAELASCSKIARDCKGEVSEPR